MIFCGLRKQLMNCIYLTSVFQDKKYTNVHRPIVRATLSLTKLTFIGCSG